MRVPGAEYWPVRIHLISTICVRGLPDRTGSPTQAARRSTVVSSGRPGICVFFQKHQKTHFCA